MCQIARASDLAREAENPNLYEISGFLNAVS
jgi:hypothetical protein